jgi:hypothetical protein
VTRYLISFDDGAMAHIPDDAWPAVGEAAARGGSGGKGRWRLDPRRRG